MNSYLAFMAAQAEHRARIERAERFGHLHRDSPPRRRPTRLPLGVLPWRSRRAVVSPAPGDGRLLADVSLALGVRQTVA